MLTVHSINALPEMQVWEGLAEQEDAALRVVVRHTSPSHYEALAQVRSGATIHYPSSGPMTADLLLGWLETLTAGHRVSWAMHDENYVTKKFVQTVQQAHRVA